MQPRHTDPIASFSDVTPEPSRGEIADALVTGDERQLRLDSASRR